MADQRSRGGKKEGAQNPQNPQQHQGTTATTSQPEKARPSDDRPRPSQGQLDQHGDRK